MTSKLKCVRGEPVCILIQSARDVLWNNCGEGTNLREHQNYHSLFGEHLVNEEHQTIKLRGANVTLQESLLQESLK